MAPSKKQHGSDKERHSDSEDFMQNGSLHMTSTEDIIDGLSLSHRKHHHHHSSNSSVSIAISSPSMRSPNSEYDPTDQQNASESKRAFGDGFLGILLQKIDRNGYIKEVLEPESIQLIILCLLWYASSAVTNNIAKQIFESVSCPVTLTFVQFAFVAIFCFLFGYFSTIVDKTLAQSNVEGILNGKSQPQVLSKSFSNWTKLSKNIQIPIVREIVRAFTFIITFTFRIFIRVIKVALKLLKYWIALGLGIHEDEYVQLSHVNQQPVSERFLGTHVLWPNLTIFKIIAPLSMFLISGHIFSSVALSNVPVSFVHTIKALSPLFTVLIFKFVFKATFRRLIYISLVPLTFGVMLACSSELTFNTIGLVCSLLSTLIFVCQNIFSKKLFKDRKLDKLNMLLYSSSISFFMMSPIWFWSEGHQLFLEDIHNADPKVLSFDSVFTTNVILLFILNGLSHFLQNVFAFSILSLVSPVTYSIASLVKRIVVIVASIIWFNQPVGRLQVIGIILTFGGLWLYQHAKHSMETQENLGTESLNVKQVLKTESQVFPSPLPKNKKNALLNYRKDSDARSLHQ